MRNKVFLGLFLSLCIHIPCAQALAYEQDEVYGTNVQQDPRKGNVHTYVDPRNGDIVTSVRPKVHPNDTSSQGNSSVPVYVFPQVYPQSGGGGGFVPPPQPRQ